MKKLPSSLKITACSLLIGNLSIASYGMNPPKASKTFFLGTSHSHISTNSNISPAMVENFYQHLQKEISYTSIPNDQYEQGPCGLIYRKGYTKAVNQDHTLTINTITLPQMSQWFDVIFAYMGEECGYANSDQMVEGLSNRLFMPLSSAMTDSLILKDLFPTENTEIVKGVVDIIFKEEDKADLFFELNLASGRVFCCQIYVSFDIPQNTKIQIEKIVHFPSNAWKPEEGTLLYPHP